MVEQWGGGRMANPLFEKTHHDVEQEIMEIGSFATILKNYADALYDGKYVSSTSDDIHTTLHGFSHLIDAHMDRMMETHGKVHRLNEWSNDDATSE
tara:strand:+ start:5296 stop:5583 length:288 start_codon:yes stop_codon:yes gene_type:complete